MESNRYLKFISDKIKDGATEYLVTAIFLIYLTNYTYGYFRNQFLSKKWLTSVENYIMQNFTMIGTEGQNIKNAGQIQFE